MSYESELEKEYSKYCESTKKSLHTKTIDLSNIEWFYPTFLLLLGVFIADSPAVHVIRPNNTDVSNYFDIMLSEPEINIRNRNYIPQIKIPKSERFRNKILDKFISSQKTEVGGRNAFGYIIGELVDNIYEHSKFSTAFIMAQQYPNMKFTEIAIIDNGISIPGSYTLKKFQFNDVQALEKALEGLSTKPEARGFGLRTTINLLTKGLHAECLIISGNAKMIANNDQDNLKITKNSPAYKGTLISTRIPFHSEDIDIYEYIE